MKAARSNEAESETFVLFTTSVTICLLTLLANGLSV